MLNAEKVREILAYDPDTGVMAWRACSKYHKEKNGSSAGTPIPSQSGKLYHKISIDGKKYSRSRLAFIWMNGRWPTEMIDHINGDSLDDRWINLREATATENAWNHKHRSRKADLPMGVRRAVSGRYVARISQHGKQHTIGTFDTVSEASAAYQKERSLRYGEFA